MSDYPASKIRRLEDGPREFCDTKGCEAPPVFQMGFKIWAKGYTKKSTPLRCETSLFLCDPCARALPIGVLLPDAGWKMIRDATMARGAAEPDRASAEIELIPILGLGARL